MAANAELELSIQTSENLDNEASKTYRLQIEVTKSTNADPHIFMFEELEQVAGQFEAGSQFVTVCTAAYMEELPIGEGSPESGYFFRTDSVDLFYRTVEELKAGKEAILRRVKELAQNLQDLGSMKALETETYTFTNYQAGSSSSPGI
jgi:hypothetical protein